MDYGNYDIEAQLAAYATAWDALDLGPVRQVARPTTLSLKVANKQELYDILQRNAERIEQVHVGTVSERHIASAVLTEDYQGLSILKFLERRPNSQDALGLDSVDYLVDDLDYVHKALPHLGIEIEQNNMHHWLSLRFGDNKQFEAKFTNHLVLEVALKELQQANDQLLARFKAA